MRNSIFQFIGGLFIGVLIALSLSFHQEEILNIFNYFRSYAENLIEKNQIKNNFNPRLNENLEDSHSINITTSSSSSSSSSSSFSSSSSLWTPGKEGWIKSFQQKAIDAVNEFIPEISNNQSLSTPIFFQSSTENLDISSKTKGKRGRGKYRQNRKDENDMKDSKLNDDSIINQGKVLEIPLSNDKLISDPKSSSTSSNNIDLFDVNTGQRYLGNVIDINQIIDPVTSKPKLLPYPIPIFYHDQAYKPALSPPYVPSLETAKALHNHRFFQNTKIPVSPLPNMTLQKAPHERENLKLHLCNAVFEAYSASYLTTREHILAIKSESYNLSWVNCEMASFTHMRESNLFYHHPKAQGMIMQSLDVLDFSVIHLSAFERSSKKYKNILWKTREEQKTQWTYIDAIRSAGELLERQINPKKSGKNITWSEESKKTVVIMPFLGGAMGAGHSELGNRFIYLATCFWSMYEFFPNIVAGVTRQEDVDWIWKQSGLPFYDILLLENLPKSAGLPLGTVRKTKEKLMSGEWNFDYIFFTESDQIIISRQLPMMHDHLKKYPRRMILPHRLMPYSYRVITEIHKRQVDTNHNKWMEQSCCLPRQNCQERQTWLSIANPDLPVINYYGLYVPLGNVNFLNEEYRGCQLSPLIPDYCP
jgi:hypothetical protein